MTLWIRASSLPPTPFDLQLVPYSTHLATALQMGDVLLDVDPGIPPRFRQDVAVVNPQSRQCVMLAPVALRMVRPCARCAPAHC